VRYRKRVVREICKRIADGAVWQQIAGAESMPSHGTFYVWLRRHPEFAQAVEEARETALHRRVGNPWSGKVLQRSAREMSDLALDTLASIMQGDGRDSTKLAAAREVLDRGHGRPKPAAKRKAKAPPRAEAMTVIVKRFSDVTPEDEAEADETEARYS
jgi:hypothetical protein